MRKIKCPDCGAGPFKNHQALGAHNRYTHPASPKPAPRKAAPRKKTSRKLQGKIVAADNGALLDQAEDKLAEAMVENWFLRFLLRRGAQFELSKNSLYGAVMLEIIGMERQLTAHEQAS